MKQLAIPPRIYSEAEARQLGTPIMAYRDKWPFIFGCICLFYSLAQGTVLSTDYLLKPVYHESPGVWFWFIVSVAFAAFCFRAAFLDRDKRLYLCNEGLLYHDSSSVEAIRWEEVEEVKLDGNVYKGHALLLLTRDFSPFRTSRSVWHDIYMDSGLWNAIEDALLPYLLARALERFERGEELVFDASRFGEIRLQRDYIKLNGRVWHLRELEGVRANGGCLSLKRIGRWEVQPGRVANARLCAALIQRCITSS